MAVNRHSEWDPDCKIYVGGLKDTTDKYELDDAFNRYGDVKNIWIARKPPGFAFIEMEDPKDAEDAVRELDGTKIGGNRVRVERSNGGRGKNGRDRYGGRDRYDDRRGGWDDDRRRGRDDDRRGGRYGRDRSRSRSRSRSRGRGRRSPSYRSMDRSPVRKGRGGSRDRSRSTDRFGRSKRRDESRSPVRREGKDDSKSPRSSPQRKPRSESRSRSRSRSYSR